MPEEKKKNSIFKRFTKWVATGLAAITVLMPNNGCAKEGLPEPQEPERPEDNLETVANVDIETQYEEALEGVGFETGEHDIEETKVETKEETKDDVEEKAKQEAEEKAKKEAEEKAKKEAEEKAKKEAEEKARQEAEEKAKKEAEEKARQEKERQEQERLEKERQEKERQEQERLEKERQEKERQEQERLEKERQEKERQEQERLEKEQQKGLEELKTILQKRGFSEEINNYIITVYNNIDKHYDSTYANNKVSKDEYLSKFRDAVENNINEINIYDLNSPEAKEYEIDNSTPAVYNTQTQNLNIVKSSDENLMVKILSHEIRHAMDTGFESILSASHSAATSSLIEGSAARGEDFAQDNVESSKYMLFMDSDSVSINEEYKLYENGMYEYMSYQRDENMYEHFECLIGMDRMEEVKSMKGDFFLNLRKELVSQFGQEAGENVLIEYIKLTKCMDEVRLFFANSEQAQIEVLQGDITFWQAFAAAKDENESKGVINSRLEEYANGKSKNEGYLEVIPNMDLTQAEKDNYLAKAKANVESYDKFYRLTNNLGVYSYEELNDFANFCVKLEEREIEALAEKRDGKVKASDWFIDFENACNEALNVKTQSISSKEDVGLAKAVAAYWYNSVMGSVTKSGNDVTKENFVNDVVTPLKEIAKGIDLGEEIVAETSTEVGRWHQQVDLRVLGDDFGR